jgi:fatty-acyl-CoA synthase
MKTLPGILAEHARRQPERIACVTAPRGGDEESLSFGALAARAGIFSGQLASLGIDPGDRVLVVLPLGQPLVVAFWGILLRGAIPSILNPSAERISDESYRRNLLNIVDITGCRMVVGHGDLALVRSEVESTRPEVVFRSFDEIAAAASAPAASSPAITSDAVALIQYSSGSTGLQKGVALSHDAILTQVRHYADLLGFGPDDSVCSWLPLYHDMGLIAAFLMPVLTGSRVVLLDPFQWATDPALLLEAISRHRTTHCWQPNFAYTFLAARVAEDRLAGIDLGSVKAWINCAEPVRPESHDRFLERFSRLGVRPETLLTCYAMAENVFAVTQSRVPQRMPVDAGVMATTGRAEAPAHGAAAVTLMASGSPIPGTSVCIFGKDGSIIPERQIGQIGIRSDCLLKEYHRNEAATTAAFREGWFMTGDLGFFFAGDLFVTGRLKDVIIIGGRNFFPHDIEEIAGRIPGVRPGRVVALGLDDPEFGTERLLVICETDDASRAGEIAGALRKRIFAALDASVDRVEVVPARWLEKTSSGKIARAANLSKWKNEFGEARETSHPITEILSDGLLLAAVALILILAMLLVEPRSVVLYQQF